MNETHTETHIERERERDKMRREPQTESVAEPKQNTAGMQADISSLGQLLVSEDDALVYLIPSFFSADDCKDIFEKLKTDVSFQRARDDFGPQERLSAYYADPGCTFAYVGLVCEPSPWPQWLDDVRNRVNEGIARRIHATECTACLINEYKEGQGAIVWHSDEVRAHGGAKLVISVSMGGVRSFWLRTKKKKDREIRIRLPVGSALVMSGETQTYWEHALPLQSRDEPHRISLTFRSIEAGYEDGREPPH